MEWDFSKMAEEMSYGEISPDILPDWLRLRHFQVVIWCDNCGKEFEYEAVQYEKSTDHLNIQAECPKCQHRVKVGVKI